MLLALDRPTQRELALRRARQIGCRDRLQQVVAVSRWRRVPYLRGWTYGAFFIRLDGRVEFEPARSGADATQPHAWTLEHLADVGEIEAYSLYDVPAVPATAILAAFHQAIAVYLTT